MNSPINSSSHSLPKISGYTIVEQLYLGSRTAVYRAISNTQQSSVAIKVLRRDYPSFGELVQFRNQYAIAKNLPIAGIIHPLSLEPLGNGYALVMEDTGGMSLGQYLQQQSLALSEVLAIALQLAGILHDLHAQRVIHKDIKPANILIHPESKQVKLIDFSIASLLPKEMQEIQNPNVLEGTLAYLAPEQTGRMNRGIDYRADFYALGVTLYQLLSGHLPFESDEPMELLHCHIAKMPVPVERVNPSVPSMVAALVAKLMAKNAEDRYQSALGLKYDLEQCQQQWQETGTIGEFELGRRDLCDRFLIPEKLYGREHEVETLLEAFDRITAGASELMLVAGFSGIGKTAVVNEVHKPITQQKGYFIKGKFDQFNRNIPFSAFVQAFRNLMGQLLGESDAQLAIWKTQILEAVGENGRTIIDVIPELEQIIGQQPPVPELSGSAAQNRFNLLFQKFVQVFAREEHPLTLFLDDLQWADLGSLELLKLLMNEAGNLFILGAYRDNEVSPTHPFRLAVNEIVKSGAIVNEITLRPLSVEDTNRLIADTLNCPDEIARPLTEIVDCKTKGNPFFTTQFLKALHQEGAIEFERDPAGSREAARGYWQCDLTRVRGLALTDDVVKFMATQLQKLPDATQTMLKLAACIGSQFDLATLAIVSEQSQIETSAPLWAALTEGLILPQNDVYKFYQDADAIEHLEQKTVHYKFLHDRVQQAAYSLIPDERKKATHLAIGQQLLNNISDSDREERIFEIVNHIDMAIDLIESPTEREEAAKLNLIAGCKAKNSTAYSAAVKYFAVGRDLLASDRWQSQYDLTLSLYVEATEAAYFNTDLDEMKFLAEAVLQQAKTALDTVKVYGVIINVRTAQGQLLEAINTGLKILKQFEIDLPESPDLEDVARVGQETQVLLGSKKPAELLDLPEMTNPQILAAMHILNEISVPAYLAKPNLNSLIIMTQMNLSMIYGNAPISALGYSSYGLFLCAVAGDLDRGYEFGQLALNLLSKFKYKKIEARVLFVATAFIIHWKVHLKETLSLMQNAYSIGWESGSLMELGYAAYGYGFHAYFMGHELSRLEQEMANYSKALEKINQQTQIDYNELYRQSVLNLLGQTINPSLFFGEVDRERELLAKYQQKNDTTGLWHFFLLKLMLCYLFQEFEQAFEYIERAEHYSAGGKGMCNIPTLHFYASLARLAIFPNQPKSIQENLWKQVVASQNNMEKWATHAPMNHLHKFHLVAAETHRILDEKTAALEMYDRAITGAKTNEYIQDEALANELAAKFYLDWGKEKVAAGYMQEAYYCYAQWGAKAKTDDLERRYPQLLRPILQQEVQPLTVIETLSSLATSKASVHSTRSQSSSSYSFNNILDLATLLQVSQVLSSTIQLDELLQTLTQTMRENSGADKCALILCQDARWQVRVISELAQTTLEDVPLENHSNVPVKLIQYVKNTLETAIIDNLQTDLPGVIGDYLNRYKPKSVLCLPILNQGKLRAILYLENRSASGVFTSARVLILNFLCTQAAISLENARLYQSLEHSLANAQQKSQDLAEVLALSDGQQKILSLIAQGVSLSTILTETARFIESHAHHPAYCSFLVIDEEGRLRYAAAPSLPATYNTLIDGIKIGPDVGSCGTAAYYKASVTVTDIATDPLWADYQVALDFGLRACSSTPIFGAEGQVLATLAMYQPVAGEFTLHDRKLMEIATYLARIAIERHQADIEIQQLNLQMIQGEKMASLGNLVAGVAHEINNPIGFLNGSINNGKDHVQDLLEHLALYQQYYPNPVAPIQDNAEEIDLEYICEDLPKLLNSMQSATDRIKSISTSLRTFSRADTEHKVSANLHEGIDSTLLILKYRLKANELRPAIQVEQNYSELPPIHCFPGQLNQVFMNIIANAIDMFDEMAQGRSFQELETNPQQITIGTAVVDHQVQISIRDNGKGMDEEVQSRIFDHLFTTKSVGKGTGLGLAIARQIIEDKHGGAIAVRSEVGRGTEFVLTLPVR